MKRNSLKMLFIVIISQLIIAGVDAQTVESLPQKTTVEKEFPNPFRPIGILFKWILGKNIIIERRQLPVSVKSLNLNRTEINYLKPDNPVSFNNPQTIEVISEIHNPKNVAIHYYHVVTVGKITGSGTKVVWDLTGIKPGKYAITVAVDDGCGVCGFTQTKTVTVKECLNCN